MSKIRIVRSKQWLNRNTKFDVLINGKNIGAVSNDDIQEFDVTDEKNTLKIKMGWSLAGSKELDFQVAENQTKTFNVSINGKIKYLTYFNFFVLITNFVLSRFGDFPYFLWILLPVVLIYLYYYTLGGDKYLVLSEA